MKKARQSYRFSNPRYGGGAFAVKDGAIFFSDFATQRLCVTAAGGATRVVTAGDPDGRYRYADADVAADGRSLACVREDHGDGGDASPADVVNEVVRIAVATGAAEVLATGRDFYSNPRISPDGESVAYVCWDHPSMPWDATEVRVVDGGGGGGDVLVDGDPNTSNLQPAWHPGGDLAYVSDASGYYNLVRAERDGSAWMRRPVLPMDVDFGGKSPGWVFGQQAHRFLPDGRLAAHYVDGASGASAVVLVSDDGTREVFSGEEHGLPRAVGALVPGPDGTFYVLGGGPDAPSAIYSWAPASRSRGKIASSSSASIPDGYASTPEPVAFPSVAGEAHGYYYAPTHATASSDEAAPPLLVKAHGGPTSCASPTYNPTIQFFTSRGFAVLDVDYGGSTGYGRAYRERLKGAWGVVDVDDVCAGAEYLVARGLADAKRLAIDGGSAGGFTTLGALAFKNTFTAGCSLYGVADLAALAGDTHKFESRYLDGLVGVLPEDAALFAARAPINSVDTLNCPVLLLQGDEDKVVPPNQAELMHAALMKKKIPTALKIYKGEQHGFRKAENIEDALNSELYFYGRVFGFEPAGDDIAPFPIDNLP